MKTYGSQYYGNYASVKENISDYCDVAVEEVDKALRSGVSKGINLFADAARQNLIREVLGAMRPMQEGGTLYSGIRCFTWRGTPTATVHILGNKGANDGTWRTRFYEGGTKQRWQKEKQTMPNGKTKKVKKRYLGRLKPTHFFENAIANNESKIEPLLLVTLQKRLEEIENKV